MGAESISGQLAWIAADWGTSALRLWAMDASGHVLDHATSKDGMGGLTPERFEPALLALIGGWLPEMPADPVPVIVCGMAGARQGWKEALYRAVPCAPVTTGGMTAVATKDQRIAVSIIPGLSQTEPADVMRGEETQLAGLIALRGLEDGVACLPGTHSKWVRIEGGRIMAFATAMTGELFALMASQSVLRHSVAAEGEDEQAFETAVRAMLADGGGLIALLFSVRAASLLAEADGATSRSRLSGLLIGAELAAMRRWWDGQSVHLLGTGSLVSAYARALGMAGCRTVAEDVEVLTLAGLSAARASMTREAE